MDTADPAKLDFAYKYPFSEEAREIISMEQGGIDEKCLSAGKLRVERDLAGDSEFSAVRLNDVKRVHVISYVYSRMLISAINSKYHLEQYISAEAKRSRNAFAQETMPGIMKVLDELHISAGYLDERFSMPFHEFLMLSPKTPEMSLVHMGLSGGIVRLHKEELTELVEVAMANEMRKKLPIPASELPKRILSEAKAVKLPEIKAKSVHAEGSYKWIDQILANPIADVRHRTVNLILAPYLTTIRGMSEEEAVKIILDYIERCKKVNPDTKVNSTYIKYQCKYSKSKGMKPLSLERARELYKGVLELN